MSDQPPTSACPTNHPPTNAPPSNTPPINDPPVKIPPAHDPFETERPAPNRLAPDRVGPDRVAPDRVGPDRVGPDRLANDGAAVPLAADRTNGLLTNDQPARRVSPPSFLLDPSFAALLTALPDARLVGGAVRDALAGRPIADIDLATKLPPHEVMVALRRAGIRAVPTGLAHGTVTAVLARPGTPRGGNQRGPSLAAPLRALAGAALEVSPADPSGRRYSVEITTLRRDVATDGRHATVAFTDDWRQDAARRDFTINAMSMTRDGAVHDYFGGVSDLHAGVVRFVGDPARRIAEDTLRVLRYFRFFARYAALPPDPPVRAALQAGIPAMANLSAERVWSELLRILAAPEPGAAVALMGELGILAAAIPEGADPAALARLLAAGAPADPLLRLAALLTGKVEPFADRLHLSGADRQRLLDLRETPLARPEDDDATLRRLLADHDRAALIDRTWLVAALDPPRSADRSPDCGPDSGPDGHPAVGFDRRPNGAPNVAPDGTDKDVTGERPLASPATAANSGWILLRDRLDRLPRPVFPLEGRDVLALGVPPGPCVGALLRATRAWWLAGGCTSGVEACRAELARALAHVHSSKDHD